MSRWSPQDDERLTRHGILALNFHEVPPDNRDEAERALRSLAGLGETWDPEQPAGGQVFVGFYDGYRDTAFWGAEVCDRLGLRAWFFPIFTAGGPGEAELGDGDLAVLAQRHSVGFHTDSHLLVTEIDEANLASEVAGPIERIHAATGRSRSSVPGAEGPASIRSTWPIGLCSRPRCPICCRTGRSNVFRSFVEPAIHRKPVVARPWTKNRWKARNSTTNGATAIKAIAIRAP